MVINAEHQDVLDENVKIKHKADLNKNLTMSQDFSTNGIRKNPSSSGVENGTAQRITQHEEITGKMGRDSTIAFSGLPSGHGGGSQSSAIYQAPINY